MIKTILSTTITATIFIGCVGTVVTNNFTNVHHVQNSKPKESDKNSTKVDSNTTLLKEMTK